MVLENCPALADNRVWPEAKALQEYGFQVSIIGPKGSTTHRESHLCVDGIHIYQYRLPKDVNGFMGYVAEYGVALCMTFWLSIKVWLRHGFDVIHVANPPDIFFIIGLLYRLFGKKFVFDQHDPAPEMFQVLFKKRAKLLYKLMLFMEWCSYNTAGVVITTNVSQKQFAITRGGCRADKVFVVRNGTDPEQLRISAPEVNLKRGQRFLLAYIGVMGIQDGVEYAIYALHDLVHKRERQDILLILMGDGEHVPALRRLVQELQIDDYVHFNGWTTLQDIGRYLAVTDVGLIPDPQNGLNE